MQKPSPLPNEPTKTELDNWYRQNIRPVSEQDNYAVDRLRVLRDPESKSQE